MTGSTYHANGSGRDTYISRDDVVAKGISQATPREPAHNPPGITPRPPSSLARGAKARGYTGHLPRRVEGVGKNFGSLSEPKNMKELIPKLELKHRYCTPPTSGYVLTSREYGAGVTASARKRTGSQTERTGILPKIPSVSGYVGYHDPETVKNEYWQQHSPGRGPPSPRATQRSTAQDGAYTARAGVAQPPAEGPRLMHMGNIPTGYTGYRPRFRCCYERDDGVRHV